TNPGYRPPASSPVTNPGYRPPASSPVTNPGYRPPVSTPKTPSSYGSASFETDTKPSETELRDDAVSSQSLKAMPVSDSAPMYTTESAAQPEHDARVVSFENKDRCTEIDKNPPDSKYDDDETINFDTVTPTLTIPTSSDAENKKDVSCDDMPAYSSEISINDKPAKKKNKIVIVFLLIAIIALLGVGGYMAYNRFFKNTADTVENSEVQNLVNAYVTAVNKNDAKTMVDISVVGALSDEQVQQVYGMSYEEMVGETRIAADLIKGMSLSVTPVDVCEMSSEEIDTINIGAPDGIRISDGIEIVCDLNISGNGTSEIKRKTFSAVKLNDNWYLFNA
ncbi:MAG: hypothetical protein II998_05395, partial [Clostridia bacterium]|nr:hypothetical protein [Clostridia bacterium]